jgi:hypothetical protein
MNWGLEDLAAAAAIILLTVIGIAMALRAAKGRLARALLIFAMVTIALVIWAHLAVGVF